MEPRLSGNDVRAEMTSPEITTETGSEVKNDTLFTAAILDLKSPYKVSLNENRECMGAAPINLLLDIILLGWRVVWEQSLWCEDNLPGSLSATRSV